MPEGAKCLKRINFAEYFRYFEMFDVEKKDGFMIPFQELSKEVYTGIYFPPPAWVRWYCPSLGNVEVRLDNLQYHCEDDDVDYYY
ncbi:hypothetical protein BVRB_9g224050 [Beta vulgaris subsp. vulgaris]|nr:hypothetical protein BVRB_9g224050 [Beta vulgaris subsp. vulgaris]